MKFSVPTSCEEVFMSTVTEIYVGNQCMLTLQYEKTHILQRSLVSVDGYVPIRGFHLMTVQLSLVLSIQCKWTR
jgi:hypothetical protein